MVPIWYSLGRHSTTNQIVSEMHFRREADSQYWKPGKTMICILLWTISESQIYWPEEIFAHFQSHLDALWTTRWGVSIDFKGFAPIKLTFWLGRALAWDYPSPTAHQLPASFQLTTHLHNEATQVKHVTAVSFHTCPETLRPSKCWHVSCLLSDRYNTENSFI